MTNIFDYIIEQIVSKNSLHGKKLLKNLKKFDKEYYKRADTFLLKYEKLLKTENKSIDYAVSCYLQMLADVNYETLQFFKTGKYSSRSFLEVYNRVYNDPKVMEYYMHGLLLSQFLWPHHYEILMWFNKVMNNNKNLIKKYLEVGGGHGLYISEAQDLIGNVAEFDLVDISQSSLNIAKKMIDNDNVKYILTDIFDYYPTKRYDFITMGEVLEHVEDPVKLLKKLSTILSDNGKLLITTPTNAPAIDHIYLFEKAEDIRNVIKIAGFVIEEDVCFFSEDVSEDVAAKFKISMMYGGLLIKSDNS